MVQGSTADAENVDFVGQIGGVTNAVFAEDDYAYINLGPRLMILDVSNPTAPILVGKTLPFPSGVCDVCVRGDHAYVAGCRAGLLIVDVSDRSNPAEVGSCDTPGIAQGVAVEGNTAYVADDEAGLRVIDVSDPSDPLEIGAYDTPGDAQSVTVEGNAAYVADLSGGLRVVDVSDPSDPMEIGSYDTPGDAYGVEVDDSTAYVAVAQDGGLRILDVSDPANPLPIEDYSIPGYTTNVAVDGNTAYVANSEADLLVVDVSDPSNPAEVGTCDTPGDATDVALNRSTAYVADDWAGMRVVDVSDPSNPEEIGAYESLGRAEDVELNGSTAYVAARYQGLRVIDVSNPSNLMEIGAYDTPGAAVDVALEGNILCVIGHTGRPDYDGWLRVVDVSDPSNPTEIGGYDTPGHHGNEVILEGGKAFVVDTTGSPDDDGWLRVVDLSDPSAPTEVGSYDTPGRATDVAVQGSTAYVADWSYGLRVIDVSDPSDLIELGAYEPWSGAYAVTAQGSKAYVANYPGLYVIDVSDPSAPVELGAYWGYPNSSRRVAVDEGLVCLTNGNRRSDRPWVYFNLYMVDVSDPSNPVEVGAYLAPGMPYGVVLDGSTVYLANSSGGLFILRYVRPQGDAYEPDDTCNHARTVATDGIIQFHTFQQEADKDWVTFDATSGTTYLIEAQVPITSSADVVAELYDHCAGLPLESQDHAFSPDVRLQFEAPTSGAYYLRLSNHDADVAGPDVSYHLSVRALSDDPTPGALVLVAGKLRRNDPLQDNIHNVTNAVYRLFKSHDYSDDRIMYLATDLNLDADDDGWSDIDAQAEKGHLEQAITQWAVDKVGPERAFTLYLMDHGGYDRFFLNGRTQTVSPDEIDGWLDALETAAPEAKVNVIVEACHSGSFIDMLKSVSGSGRVVIASTGAHAVAYASQDGAIFSDAFLGALGRDMSLYNSFAEAQWSAREAHPSQVAWLDDDGDGIPNESEDGQEAQRRGFAYAGTFAGDEQWPPYVPWAQVRDVADGEGVIEAEVRDDRGVLSVWAVVYKPSYQAPDPEETEELPQEDLPTVMLLDQDGDDVYTGMYEGFDELGAYRVVIYSVDGDELEGRPEEIEVRTGWPIYLPVLMKES